MTEDEAKTKWCPFARTLDWTCDSVRSGDEPVMVAASVNRRPGHYDKYGNETVEIGGRHRCIGSACMAWRGFDANDEAALAGMSGSGALGPDWKPTHGFCGLAGAPQ